MKNHQLNNMYSIRIVTILILILISTVNTMAQHHSKLNLNKPEREQWFSELGFGMFIHWSFDVQLGMVISHSVVSASDDYLDRYFEELPKTFDPMNFQPEKWAKAAKMAGMKYVVFTTKHHSGFCMYDTETTDFKVTNTPMKVDVTKKVLDAFRKEGIATGIYFSPDDFWYMYDKGREIGRKKVGGMPSDNPDLIEYLKTQMRELMTNYGEIEIVFIDGVDIDANVALAKICWEKNENVVVTRGAIETPEQNIPNRAIPSPWEACFTMGDQWQYRPTNENYKSTKDLINKIIEIRCKGGNLLLNVGPNADGELPVEQEGYLNEVALWYFINKEALENVEPWNIVREGDVWFLKKKGNESIVYAFLTGEAIQFGARKNLVLQSLKASKKTKVTVLGHDNKSIEYAPEVDGAHKFEQTNKGLLLSIFRGQRIYNDRDWSNPLVVKLENVVYNGE